MRAEGSLAEVADGHGGLEADERHTRSRHGPGRRGLQRVRESRASATAFAAKTTSCRFRVTSGRIARLEDIVDGFLYVGS